MALIIRLTPFRLILAGIGGIALAAFLGWIVLCSRAYGEFTNLNSIQARCSVPREMRRFVCGMPLKPDSLTCQMQTYSNGVCEWRMHIQFPVEDWEVWKERYRGYLSTVKSFTAEKYGEDHYRATIRLDRGQTFEFRIMLRQIDTKTFILFNGWRRESDHPGLLERIQMFLNRF